MKNIVIIGGGPAGLQASGDLERLGYNVILVEQSPTLGGHLAKWDRLFPSGEKAKDVLGELTARTSGVKCFTDTKVQSINLLNLRKTLLPLKKS